MGMRRKQKARAQKQETMERALGIVSGRKHGQAGGAGAGAGRGRSKADGELKSYAGKYKNGVLFVDKAMLRRKGGGRGRRR